MEMIHFVTFISRKLKYEYQEGSSKEVRIACANGVDHWVC